MRHIFLIILSFNFTLASYGQEFRFIKPVLTDSTKVVITEIDSQYQLERIYFIDYSIISTAKSDLMNFGPYSEYPNESIGFTYYGILNNLETRPPKIASGLSAKWVKLFKYKGEWILFNDIPKYILTDSSLMTFDLDDPNSSVITQYKYENKKHEFNLLSYDWSRPETNIKSYFEIKVLDPKKMITLWKFYFQGEVSYDLMVPESHVSKFPIMVMMETELMDDENEIFDEMDLEKLWNE